MDRWPRLQPAIWLVALGIGLSPIAAQVPPPATETSPTFRAEINHVEITVRAVTASGEFVGDLKQADFQVLEDGRPQTISTFALIKAPAGSADAKRSAAAAGPRPRTEVGEADRAAADRQVYLFVLDDLHIRPEYSFKTRAVGYRFVDAHMSAGDVAGVVFTSGVANQDLTTDKAALRQAFARFVGEWNSPYPYPVGLRYGLSVSKTLANMSDWLARIPGRHKAVIYVSSGVGCNVGYVNAREDSEDVGVCRDAVLDAVDAANHGNVSIYSIDPQGMAVGSAQQAVSDAPLSRQQGGRSPVESVRDAQVPGPIHGIRAVAEMTGGFFELDATRLDRFLGRVVRENSSYYLIGYYSSNDEAVKARTVHTNEIRVARRGVTAYYRRQYAVLPESSRKP
jgi:VWFA-related protein